MVGVKDAPKRGLQTMLGYVFRTQLSNELGHVISSELGVAVGVSTRGTQTIQAVDAQVLCWRMYTPVFSQHTLERVGQQEILEAVCLIVSGQV